MTEKHTSEVHHEKENRRDIILIIAWAIILTLCAFSLKKYYLNGQPPLWDNLDYQKRALHILTNWLDGDSENALKSLYTSRFPAYLFAIASSFLLFGFNPFSPYLVSAFFGGGCIVIVFLLSKELGATRRMALVGAIAFSLLPNFIYQNFLQTRNDFPLAFFIGLCWIYFLRSIKNENKKYAFLAGIFAGIGTLFKASAPGYVIWGILVFLLLPEKYNVLAIKSRFRLVAAFSIGAFFSCGWHFLPNFGNVLEYYKAWGKGASTWQAIQYNMQLDWTDYLFYPKNLIQVQLGEKVAIGLAVLMAALWVKNYLFKKSEKTSENNSKETKLLFLIFFGSLLSIIFVSFRRVFASIGDIPVLPIFVAGFIAYMSKLSFKVHTSSLWPLALLPFILMTSLSNLDIVERQFSGKDINALSYETMNIRKEFGLGNTPMIQVFSHPIYNVYSLAWLWLINPETDRNSIHQTTKNRYQLMFPEDGETIASKLKKFPLLIISDFPGTTIQGEKFNTLNRLHSQINSAIYKQGQFLKIRSLNLEDGKFPIHFMLNKNFSVLSATHITEDNWVKWGGEADYFSLKQTKLIWRAVPIRKIESFKLVDKNNEASFIKMKLNKTLPNGKYEYKSETVPSTDKLVTFIVMPESSNLLLPASKMDKRMLAFNEVETEVIKYD